MWTNNPTFDVPCKQKSFMSGSIYPEKCMALFISFFLLVKVCGRGKRELGGTRSL